MLAELGARVTDADDLARSLLRPGTPQYRAVLDLFGRSILRGTGEIDRRRRPGKYSVTPAAWSVSTGFSTRRFCGRWKKS
jgi:hypothetical protein